MKKENYEELIDNSFCPHTELMKAVAKGDKCTADMIAKSGLLNTKGKRTFDYYKEAFGYNKNQLRYSNHFKREVFVESTNLHRDSPREIKEYTLKRNGINTVAKFTKTQFDLFKKEGDDVIPFYIYTECIPLENNMIRLEEYCTRSREEIQKILDTLKELKYDVTGHNIVKELFYNRRADRINVTTKAFVEILNRAMDREKYGTSKMFANVLSLKDAIQKKCKEVYRLETLWWELREKKLNYRDKRDNLISNPKEFLPAYSLNMGDGGVSRSYYEVKLATRILVDVGLVREWEQQLAGDRLTRTWTGVTPKGWSIVESILGYVPEGHITRYEDIEKIEKYLKKIDTKKYLTEYDIEYNKNLKSKHSFIV